MICLANNNKPKVTRNAMLTSNFCTLVVTIKPRLKTPKRMTILLPHWPGLIQALFVKKIVHTIPKAEGLKICFLLKRIIYLDKMEIKAANAATKKRLVFNNKDNPNELINTDGIPDCNLLNHAVENRFALLVLKTISHNNCVTRLTPK